MDTMMAKHGVLSSGDLAAVAKLLSEHKEGKHRHATDKHGICPVEQSRFYDDDEDSWIHKAILLSSEPDEYRQQLNNASREKLNKTDDEGYTPLHLACIQRLPNWVEELLRKKADPECRTVAHKIGVGKYDSYELGGNTALHLAFEVADLDCIKLLVDAKASLDAVNDAGLKPYNMLAISVVSQKRRKEVEEQWNAERRLQVEKVRPEDVENRVKYQQKRIDSMDKIRYYFKLRRLNSTFVSQFYNNWDIIKGRTKERSGKNFGSDGKSSIWPKLSRSGVLAITCGLGIAIIATIIGLKSYNLNKRRSCAPSTKTSR